ncbi:hypothetical protein [Anatilimnocola aggregata]|uniref:hypothetical protein n=1 Tax=Anatilimnocola aggregata TaxID=2528021 RepID=UPI001EE415A5|nr:hypothetical protein [Anatilimnocola aggregata]
MAAANADAQQLRQPTRRPYQSASERTATAGGSRVSHAKASPYPVRNGFYYATVHSFDAKFNSLNLIFEPTKRKQEVYLTYVDLLKTRNSPQGPENANKASELIGKRGVFYIYANLYDLPIDLPGQKIARQFGTLCTSQMTFLPEPAALGNKVDAVLAHVVKYDPNRAESLFGTLQQHEYHRKKSSQRLLLARLIIKGNGKIADIKTTRWSTVIDESGYLVTNFSPAEEEIIGVQLENFMPLQLPLAAGDGPLVLGDVKLMPPKPEELATLKFSFSKPLREALGTKGEFFFDLRLVPINELPSDSTEQKVIDQLFTYSYRSPIPLPADFSYQLAPGSYVVGIYAPGRDAYFENYTLRAGQVVDAKPIDMPPLTFVVARYSYHGPDHLNPKRGEHVTSGVANYVTNQMSYLGPLQGGLFNQFVGIDLVKMPEMSLSGLYRDEKHRLFFSAGPGKWKVQDLGQGTLEKMQKVETKHVPLLPAESFREQKVAFEVDSQPTEFDYQYFPIEEGNIYRLEQEKATLLLEIFQVTTKFEDYLNNETRGLKQK